ncbi:MAG TPA: CDP-alcohol phosphatidyltransferase family protein [Streptosporangiaceae bacterium]|jgi:CDP-diacylglycerol--glycerol-3-phosphate 3-phosphatidyltransferase
MLKALRPLLARLLRPVGEALARTPITPNMITAIGTVGVAIGALWLFPTGHLFAGTLVCWGFAMFDMLDGLLARVKGTSGPWGAFLDSTLDRIGDSAVFGGLAIYLTRDHQPVLACVALFCLVAGSMVSYARARAEGIGVRADVGVAERSERLVLVLVVTGLTGLGVPFVLAIGLWVLAVASTVTFVQRVLVVRKAVGPGAAPRPAPQAAAGAAGPAGGPGPGPGPGPGAAGNGGPGAGPATAVRDPGDGGARKDKA